VPGTDRANKSKSRPAEEMLRQQEQFFRSLIEHACEAFLVIDSDGLECYVSPSYQHIMGYSPEEREGGSMLDNVHPEDASRVNSVFLQLLREPGAVERVELRARHKDGSWRFIEAIGKNRLDDPAVAGIVVTMRDISERMQADEKVRDSERRLRALVEHARDAITVLGADGKLLYESPAPARMLGYEPGMTKGKTSFELIHPDDMPVVADTLKRLLQDPGGAEDLEVRVRHSDGSWRSMEVTACNLLDDTAVGGIVVNQRDITEHKRALEEISKLNEEQERRVVERTTQLQAVNGELEAFAYSVSHDLRTPLRSIDGFSQILLEDYSETIDERGKDYLRRVRLASQRMSELIDDLLSLSRVTRGQMQRETVDLSALARTVATGLEQGQPERQVEFVIEQGIAVDGDDHLLRVALDNLLGNAWKFTGKTPRATIEFGRTQDNGRQTYFVRDNGVGFDMAYADKLFGTFQRLHSPSEFEGTGIGLATVQRIIHRHGGKIWAESAVGEGTTFSFTL